MAPSRPARITDWVTAFRSIMPLPTVFATAVPKPKAATKLKNAAQITAFRGDRTRVDTTVAMEFAASWKPFRKSKIRANRMMTTTMIKTELIERRASTAFQDNRLQHIGYVLGFIDGAFQNFVNFFPLD